MRKNYYDTFAKLRTELKENIANWLKVNGTPVAVEHNAITYIDYGTQMETDNENELYHFPEVEITTLTLDNWGEFIFFDAKGREGYATALSTDDLWYIYDYLYYKHEKWSKLSSAEKAEN